MKIIKFLDYKNSSIISTFEHFSDYYKSKGNIKIPEVLFLETLFTLYCKTINKIIVLVFVLFRIKWFIRPPKKSRIVLLGYDRHFKLIYSKKNFIKIPINIYELKEIYFTPEILKNFLYFKVKKNYSLKISYFAALIKFINPKKIISFNDNYEEFHQISKIFYSKNIEIIAVQNAVRFIKQKFYDCKFHKFLTFGEFEKKIYKDEVKIRNIDKIISIGSFKSQLAVNYFKKNNLKLRKRFDVCLISEPDARDIKNYTSSGLLADYAIQYCEKNNKKLIFSGKSDLRDYNEQKAEKKFYEINSKSNNLKIKFQNKSKFDSYRNIAESKLTIAVGSTMLREAIHFETKVLACRFFKGNDYFLPSKKINYISNCFYKDFEKKLNFLLEMPYSSYLKQTGNLTYLYNKKVNSLKKINQILNK